MTGLYVISHRVDPYYAKLLILWWAQQDSNLRLPPCEGGTLPLSYAPNPSSPVSPPAQDTTLATSSAYTGGGPESNWKRGSAPHPLSLLSPGRAWFPCSHVQ